MERLVTLQGNVAGVVGRREAACRRVAWCHGRGERTAERRRDDAVALRRDGAAVAAAAAAPTGSTATAGIGRAAAASTRSTATAGIGRAAAASTRSTAIGCAAGGRRSTGIRGSA